MPDEFIHLIPDSLLRQPGRAFNSGRLAFSAPAGTYVLLLNPTASATPQPLAFSVCSANETFANYKRNFTP